MCVRWGLGRHQQCVLPPTLGLQGAGGVGEGWMGHAKDGCGPGPQHCLNMVDMASSDLGGGSLLRKP